jgi:hypothetical protein
MFGVSQVKIKKAWVCQVIIQKAWGLSGDNTQGLGLLTNPKPFVLSPEKPQAFCIIT